MGERKGEWPQSQKKGCPSFQAWARTSISKTGVDRLVCMLLEPAYAPHSGSVLSCTTGLRPKPISILGHTVVMLNRRFGLDHSRFLGTHLTSLLLWDPHLQNELMLHNKSGRASRSCHEAYCTIGAQYMAVTVSLVFSYKSLRLKKKNVSLCSPDWP